VLVAGLQLRDISSATERGTGTVWLAAVAGLAAIALALTVVLLAGSVLATPRPTTRDLSSRELRAGGAPKIVRLEPVKDKTIQEILRQRTYLLGDFDSVHGFYAHMTECRTAYDRLALGHSVELDGVDYSPSAPEDARKLSAILDRVLQRSHELERAAQYFETRSSFTRLTRSLAWGCVPFVLALLGYSWATRPFEYVAPRITQPTPMTVYVLDARLAGLPSTCTSDVLDGVGVGGTYDEPLLIVFRAPGCPPMKLKPGKGLLAVPKSSVTK